MPSYSDHSAGFDGFEGAAFQYGQDQLSDATGGRVKISIADHLPKHDESSDLDEEPRRRHDSGGSDLSEGSDVGHTKQEKCARTNRWQAIAAKPRKR